jgi:hypothetical protein
MISVTITGADDAVDPRDMVELSAEFPFLEWGILLSTKRMGTPRYPTVSPEWASRMLELASECLFSAHLCGDFARRTAYCLLPSWLPAIFGRCQINGYDSSYCNGVTDLSLDYPIEFILQCRSVDDLQPLATQSIMMGRASVLFDPSGGRGIESCCWPVAPLNTKIGFAGGIGPDNVEMAISGIIASNQWLQSFWIDMESGVRTDDRLDFDKVTDVLRKVEAINGRMAGRDKEQST